MKRPRVRCIVTRDGIFSGWKAGGESLRDEKLVRNILLKFLAKRLASVTNANEVTAEEERA